MAHEGSESQTANTDDSEERQYVLALFLYSPQVSITCLCWRQSTSSRDLSSLLVQSHADGSPSGKTSGKCRELKVFRIKYVFLCWLFRLTATDWGNKFFFFFFLISWVKRKWLVTVNLNCCTMRVWAQTLPRISKWLLKDFYGYSTLKGCWMRSMDANRDHYVWLTLPISFPSCLWGSFSALNVFLGNFI